MKVGIDFGTSTSEIALVDEHGKVTVIPNHLGDIITPSFVYFPENGSPVVGREAKERAFLEPESTFLEIKRRFGDRERLDVRGKQKTPAEIAAEIIGYLVKCAEEYTGADVGSAVITVPAYFTDAQRRDVLEAGALAGVEVSRIINEPTAAALDYGIKNMSSCEHILVYDLGGGTLDVTVLELFEGVVDVKSCCGNNALGGKDFDQAIIDHIVKSIKKRHKVDLTTDARAMMRIKIAAEDCKVALSDQNEQEIDLPFLFSGKDGSPVGFAETISRAAFNNLINDKIYSTKTQIQTALDDADLSPDDIDMVLMVGGSTRIPLVSQFLEYEFGFVPKSAVDPDLAVVSGAAVQAGVLDGILSENAVVLTDICPYSLSTEVLKDSFFGIGRLVCDVLIPRNTTLPASTSKIYATSVDDQRSVRVSAYQGESDEPDENYMLNTFMLSGIPKGRAGSQKVNIRFEYDLNGILDVTAQIVSTGKTANVTVNTSEIKNVDLTKWKDHPLSKTYRRLINKADRLSKIHEDADAMTAAANELKKGLVLDWDQGILNKLHDDLKDEIEELED